MMHFYQRWNHYVGFVLRRFSRYFQDIGDRMLHQDDESKCEAEACIVCKVTTAAAIARCRLMWFPKGPNR